MRIAQVQVGSRSIGQDHPCFVIAEAGVNHDGRIDLAEQLVDRASRANADAVKFQTFRAEALTTTQAPKAEYQKETTGSSESQYDMLKRLELSHDSHRQLKDYCGKKGILFLSTPFDEESADFLAELGVAAFKVPSGEITNLPFLEHVAARGAPIILSTGMSRLDEVRDAVRAIEKTGNRQYVLLHCVSRYPASPAEANLRAMETMRDEFGVPVGFSDHTPGIEVSLAAVALGACVIEKHLTLDRSMPGPDHGASLEPDEFAALVKGIRTVESALGHGRKEPVEGEAEIASVARRSLVAARDIPAGATLTEEMIAARRPGTGIPPAGLSSLLGRKVRDPVAAGALLEFEMLS